MFIGALYIIILVCETVFDNGTISSELTWLCKYPCWVSSVWVCVCVHKCLCQAFFFFFFCKMCLSDDAQTLLSKCVCVHVCPIIDVCEGPSRGAKSKASGHNWVIGTGDGLKHGSGDAAATLGCLRCQGQSALINRLGPYITALVVLAARSRQALWDFSLRQATFLFPFWLLRRSGHGRSLSFSVLRMRDQSNRSGRIICFI